MIKNPNVVRDKILSDVMFMFKHLYSMLSFLPETEVDVMLCLEHPQVHDLALEITNVLMVKFGHEATPSEPRYCKTRRNAAKSRLKGPRGEGCGDGRTRNGKPKEMEAT